VLAHKPLVASPPVAAPQQSFSKDLQTARQLQSMLATAAAVRNTTAALDAARARAAAAGGSSNSSSSSSSNDKPAVSPLDTSARKRVRRGFSNGSAEAANEEAMPLLASHAIRVYAESVAAAAAAAAEPSRALLGPQYEAERRHRSSSSLIESGVSPTAAVPAVGATGAAAERRRLLAGAANLRTAS
jgi:hypothetical protein